jgi:protein-S-isoprenylcysteine O-methyltransferase Ste14
MNFQRQFVFLHQLKNLKITGIKMNSNRQQISLTKKTFWITTGFYLLIGFEFFYMATPFALYFYAVYNPGLKFLNDNPTLSWLTSMFLPHIVVETKSALLNSRNILGIVVTIAGFFGFIVGASQVYYSKIFKKKAVTAGIYKIIRHPQYLSLMICSFGLLILWPRYIVLLSFITMLFVYYFLAKVEENECERKFGDSYSNYMRNTFMFLPFHLRIFELIPGLPKQKYVRYTLIFIYFLITSSVTILAANSLKNWSLNSLYAIYNYNSAFISLTEMENNTINQLINTVKEDPKIKNILGNKVNEKNSRFISYILPADLFMLEIPMNPVENESGLHFIYKNQNKNIYRIVITKADLGSDRNSSGESILLNVKKRIPLLEVVIDIRKNKVTDIEYPTNKIIFENIPMPVF